MASGSEVLRQFLTIRKNSYKYAPAFQRLHALVNGANSAAKLRARHQKRLGINVVLGEKSDLGLCQLADTLADRLKLADLGVSARPAKSPAVYYGHLAAQQHRYAVPSELKYTESSYSSRNVYIWLWTDVQQEAPDLHTQIFTGPTSNCNVYSFGHVHNARAGVKPVGGMEEFVGWLEGRTNLFSRTPKLETRLSNVYVLYSDNFLEMFPTNYGDIFKKIEELLGDQTFVSFSYLSRHPVSYNAVQTYAFPPVTQLLKRNDQYRLNVLTNVQRQDYSENESRGRFTARLMCHSTLLRADQPMNELVIAQKTPAEDNAALAYIDKFGDYKSAINSIFISEFSDKLQLMHPHQLLTYAFALLAWPRALARLLPLTSIPKADEEKTFKATHSQFLERLIRDFDNDPTRLSLIHALSLGRPALVEDLRLRLWPYTVVPGTAFNVVKAKALLQRLNATPEYSPDGPYYEFQTPAAPVPSAAPTPAPQRVALKSDSIFAIDCEFVRHSMPLRGHINEVNRKQHLSWCKLAPESK
uniref:NDUFS1b n=1 Tax=Euglena gracilis TaxID=3039 RepID=UPI002FE4FB02|eukprot:EG_transcript_7035